MRFLALTGLQAALLALITVGAIVGLYFLKLRHKKFVVASSMLWSRVLDERQAQSIWEKLRRLISILMAVLIGLLIAMGIARPEIHLLTGGGERTLLVLDTSPTMLARTSSGETRWERAVTAALAIVNASAPSSEFRVADTSGRVDVAPTADRREIREAIERMQPMAGPARFPTLDSDTPAIRFITDGVVPVDLPKGTVRESVFEQAENVGITAFEIRSTPSSPQAYEAYLEVHNYGRQAKQTTLSITGTGGQHIDRVLELRAGEEFSQPFDLSRFEGGGIRATVQTDRDAFAIDDTAYSYLPVDRTARTLLVTTGSPYLQTLLTLDSLVNLTVIKPEQYQPDSGFDVTIFDGFTPLNPPTRPSLLIGESVNGGWLPRSLGRIAAPRFDTWNEDHPIMRYVSLHDVSVQRATRVDATGLTVLASAADESPLIVASEAPDAPKWILVTFNLQNSDFPLHTAFPLFVDNALAWLSREPLALRRQPGLVSVPLEKAEVRELNGNVIPSHSRGRTTVFEVSEPGLYTAVREDHRQTIAVNLASRQYSNVNKTTVSSKDQPAAASAGWLQKELWYYMLVLAGLLLGLEWFTYHRGITV